MKNVKLLLGCLALVILFAACIPLEGSIDEVRERAGEGGSIVTGVSLDKTTLSLFVGESASLVATVKPNSAVNKEVNWSSGNESVAKITDGTVKAVSAGTALISVITVDGGKTASCLVTVSKPGLIGLSITSPPAKVEYAIGETLNLTGLVVTGQYEDGSSGTVSIGMESISGFDSKTAGVKNVTITYSGKTAQFQVTVYFVNVTSISLDKTTLTLTVGDKSAALIPTITPSNASNKNVNWSSVNNGIATVSNGVVTAVFPGSTTIIATTVDQGKTAMCNVTVNPIMYEVTFNSMGGSAVTKASVADGGLIIKPTNPVWEGRIFDGWYKESGCINEWIFTSNTVTGPTTLYAKWGFVLPLINVNFVEPYLATLTGGASPDDPVELQMSVHFYDIKYSFGPPGSSGPSNWYNLLAAIINKGKYINLDISSCTMEIDTFSPPYYNLGEAKIVSIILPDQATAIQSSSIDGIGQVFFDFTELKKVVGKNIEVIKPYAFQNFTALKEVSFPNLKTLWGKAFPNCVALETITMPKSITIEYGGSIYNYYSSPFSGCTMLKSFKLTGDTGGLSTMENDSILVNTGGTRLVAYPSASGTVVLDSNITIIGSGAFIGCTSLQVLKIPNVVLLESCVFENTGGTNLSIYTGQNAPGFDYRTNLFREITVPKNVYIFVPSGAVGYGPVPSIYSGTDNTPEWGNILREVHSDSGGGVPPGGSTIRGVNSYITVNVNYQ